MNIRENITRKEAECPHCQKLPSDDFLDLLQTLRTLCDMPLNFSSIYRCPDFNRMIGGSHDSLHTQTREYGAGDIKTRNFKKRYIIITKALKLGFNNIEVCNYHLHVGKAPKGHRQENSFFWGISK